MDNRNYFDVLAKQLEGADFNDVFETLGSEYVGKSLEEVVNLILNSDKLEKFEQLNAYSEKYEDDFLDLREDLKSVEEEYQEKLDEAIKEQEEANRRRINHIKDYNEYNSEITSYVDDSRDQVNSKLRKVEEELSEIARKEELLNGNLSRRLSKRKEELLNEKASLENDKSDYEDLKKEAYYLAKEEEKNIKNAQDKRNNIIKELAEKKVELYKEQGNINKSKKKYLYVMNQVATTFFNQKSEVDKEFEQAKKEFEEKIASGDLTDIAGFSKIYLDASNKKIEYEKKYQKILDILKIDINETTIEIDKTDVKDNSEDINTKVELPVNEEIETEKDEKVQNLREKLTTPREEIISNEEENNLTEHDIITVNDYKIQNYNEQLQSLMYEGKTDNFETIKNYINSLEHMLIDTNMKLKENSIAEELKKTNDGAYILEDYLEQYNTTYDNYLSELGKTKTQNEEKNETTEMNQSGELNPELPKIFQDVQQEPEVTPVEDYGFEPNPVIQPIEAQPTQPIELNNVLPAENNPEVINPFVMNQPEEVQPVELTNVVPTENKEEVANPFGTSQPVENNVQQEPEVTPVEDYGFEPNPTIQPIEAQPTQPVELNNVLPVEKSAQPENTTINTPNNGEFIDSKDEQENKESNTNGEWIEEEEELMGGVNEEAKKNEKQSDGFFKKLFGHKSNNEEKEHEITKIEEITGSLIEKFNNFNDSIHKRYLNEEAYNVWKNSQESKGRGM